jgi:hypothetical protein
MYTTDKVAVPKTEVLEQPHFKKAAVKNARRKNELYQS